jgi:hypothetical protein
VAYVGLADGQKPGEKLRVETDHWQAKLSYELASNCDYSGDPPP